MKLKNMSQEKQILLRNLVLASSPNATQTGDALVVR